MKARHADLELGQGIHAGVVSLGVEGLSSAGLAHPRGVHLEAVALQCVEGR